MRYGIARTTLLLFLMTLAPHYGTAQSCQLFAAALEVVGAKPDSTILVDRTAMGVPAFAFMAFSDLYRGDTALARRMEPALRTLNATRVPIPACLSDSLGWHTITDSTLVAFFSLPEKRWVAFRSSYPATPKFAILSRPIIVGDTATVFVAIASGDLAGRGLIVRLLRDAAGRWFKHSEVQLWVS